MLFFMKVAEAKSGQIEVHISENILNFNFFAADPVRLHTPEQCRLPIYSRQYIVTDHFYVGVYSTDDVITQYL